MNRTKLCVFHCGAIHYIKAFEEWFTAWLHEKGVGAGSVVEKTIITTYTGHDEAFRKDGFGQIIHYPHGKYFDLEQTPSEFFQRVNGEQFDYFAYFCDKKLPVPQSNLIGFLQRFEPRFFVPFHTRGFEVLSREELHRRLAGYTARPLDHTPFPRAVALCTTDFCNSNCTFCCLKTQGVQPKETILRFADFRTFYPQVLDKVDHIDFSLGEIFTNPEAGDFLNYVFRTHKDKKISIYSNAIGMKQEYIERIMSSEQDFEIDISLNATSRETYRKVMQVDAFERVLGHIDLFRQLRRATGQRQKKRVVLSYLLNIHTLDEFPAILDLMERYEIDGLVPRIMKIYQPGVFSESVFFNQARYNEVILQMTDEAARRGINFSRPPLFTGATRLTPLARDQGHRIKCDSPWAIVYLRANGDVSLCANWNTHIGNIRRQSFDEIWNGPAAAEARRRILAGDNPRECWACECNFAEDDWLDSLSYHCVWGFQQHLLGVRFNDDYGYDHKGDFLA